MTRNSLFSFIFSQHLRGLEAKIASSGSELFSQLQLSMLKIKDEGSAMNYERLVEEMSREIQRLHERQEKFQEEYQKCKLVIY